MGKSLIIVESPAKARTIKGFLDDSFEVIASKGHIRDLPKYAFGIKIVKNRFEPQYKIDKEHQKVVDEIKKRANSCDNIYIATDEDREGEAIGFHIAHVIKKDPNKLPRIVFHEITKQAILEALKNPRNIDMHRVNAQQARRLLDRIVGYKLSPLISSKIQKGLSAGRVQSSALKLIVDREREIKAFIPQEYYTIDAIFEGEIESELIEFEGKKLEKLDIKTKKEADEIVLRLLKETFIVKEIEKKSKKSPTPPPFMTSTLQATASSKLGFSPKKTMMLAQILYEGVETPKGISGVITYMRTDSLNIAKEAIDAARDLILKKFGKEYLPKNPKSYVNKSKSAQEAHEAIRPVNLDFTPEIAKKYLKNDEYELYKLIYERFLGSQMEDALFESQNIFFASKSGVFKVSGRKLIFDGFYKLIGDEEKDKLLPNLKKGESIKLVKIEANQHFTEPPARYSEASLIKKLEALGIGRPSTYAPTISILQSRNYITIENKQIVPTEIGFKVTELLENYFEEIVDATFTAKMEDELDLIAENKKDWQELLWEFYKSFEEKIILGKQEIKSLKKSIPTGEFCPKCGSELVIRNGKFGDFIACSAYPKCKYSKTIEQEKVQEQEENKESSEICEKCGRVMIEKKGKNGVFLACSGYPECKNTKSLKKEPEVINEVTCPECNGAIVKRYSKRGVFYGCKNYPNCNFISNYLPINKKCPKCGYLMAKREYRKKEILECIKCKYKESQE